jgi:hypothetical protein
MGKQCSHSFDGTVEQTFGDLKGKRRPYCQRHPDHDGDCHWKATSWTSDKGVRVVRSISVSWPKKEK